MYLINFLIIPIILFSLGQNRIKSAYVIALISSLICASFIHAGVALSNLLFTIAIFNLTPLACLRFTSVWGERKQADQRKRDSSKTVYEQMLKERSLIRQSNSQLSRELFQTVELYRMMRDMSAGLSFPEIFNVLGKKLMENFRFKKCRLILMDEDREGLKLKKVLELKYAQAYPQEVLAEMQDDQILKQSFRAQRTQALPEKSLVSTPLMADKRFLGALAVEDLPQNGLEIFSILADQFSLEFKRIKLYQKIQELAITDGLSGLFVRRYFLQRLEEEMGRSARHNLRLAFLLLDIDHFKQCNDRFGHLTGDAVIKEVGSKIKSCVREIDLVARYGGEEFSVLLPSTDKIGAGLAAERIRAAIQRHRFQAYDETIGVEVSIGVALYPENATGTQELIDKADQALYRAKQEGRNRVCIYS